MKIVGMCQVYNELQTGNLKRCLEHYSKMCDELVLLDDASTDGSDKILKEYSHHIITNKENNWERNLETLNKSLLLEKTLELEPNWIISFDCDEMFEKHVAQNIRTILTEVNLPTVPRKVNSMKFNWINLWLSERWYRIDGNLGMISPPRIWRNLGKNIMGIDVVEGLHKRLWPEAIEVNSVHLTNLNLIHYSSCSEAHFYRKIANYLRLHPAGNYRSLLETDKIRLCEVDDNWYESLTFKERSPDVIGIHHRIEEQLKNEGLI